VWGGSACQAAAPAWQMLSHVRESVLCFVVAVGRQEAKAVKSVMNQGKVALLQMKLRCGAKAGEGAVKWLRVRAVPRRHEVGTAAVRAVVVVAPRACMQHKMRNAQRRANALVAAREVSSFELQRPMRGRSYAM